MRTFETMENRIVIAFVPGGVLVIGKIAEGIMINPRIIKIEESKEAGKIGIRFQPLFGDPEVFFFEYGQYYISENAELNELYETAIEPKRVIVP